MISCAELEKLTEYIKLLHIIGVIVDQAVG